MNSLQCKHKGTHAVIASVSEAIQIGILIENRSGLLHFVRNDSIIFFMRSSLTRFAKKQWEGTVCTPLH